MVVVRLLLASTSRGAFLVRSRGASFEKTSMRAPATPVRAAARVEATRRTLVKSIFLLGEEMVLMVESQEASLLAGWLFVLRLEFAV